MINMPLNVLQTNIDEETWVAVNFGKVKPQIYFGKVISVIKQGELYTGTFTRPSTKNKNLDKYIHLYPDMIDFSEFNISQIIRILKPTESLRRNRWKFEISVKHI